MPLFSPKHGEIKTITSQAHFNMTAFVTKKITIIKKNQKEKRNILYSLC